MEESAPSRHVWRRVNRSLGAFGGEERSKDSEKLKSEETHKAKREGWGAKTEGKRLSHHDEGGPTGLQTEPSGVILKSK